MAESPTAARVEVDVVIRSVRLVNEPTLGLPAPEELARALCETEGVSWDNTSALFRQDCTNRAVSALHLLGSGRRPTPCSAAEPGSKAGTVLGPLLVCSLNEGHTGAHRTKDGATFILKDREEVNTFHG